MHPRDFGQYRIVRLLPLGGMGRVYLAVDTQTNEEIALKLIDRGPDSDRQEIVAAERRGALLQERLCALDRRIVCVRKYGDLDDFFFIEMEYIEGQDLSELLAKGPLGVPFATRIAKDLCEVLAVTHGFTGYVEGQQYAGVVHGDVKPRNIRITPTGEVKVLDFGIAKALSLTRQFTTNQFASSQYSSPERLNTGEVDIASDLWSVGVVLYEIVTGRPYFEAESAAKVEHLIRRYAEARPLPAHLPLGFRAVLLKALHPEPQLRYATARAFADDLGLLLEGRSPAAVSLLEDSEKTRRTTGAVDDPEATRRTGPALPLREGRHTAVPASPSKQPRTAMSRRERQVRFFAGLALVTIVFLLFFNEYSVWRKGAELTRELDTERLTDMNTAWTRYEALAKGSFLPVVLSGPRSAIRGRLMAAADRTLTEYRSSDAPTVTENDWVRALASLNYALQLDPGDGEIRAKMAVCEGHIARIRGTARGNSKLLNEARANFEEAASLAPKSPDPHLGLARLYTYSLKDVDRAEAALRAAEKRGHDRGRREKSQLADGYRDRAERLLREADRASGMAEERDYLERARDDFRRAEELYRDVLPFAGSPASLRRVLDFEEHIEQRLDSIKEGA
jgi:serine/threonine protein kinase